MTDALNDVARAPHLADRTRLFAGQRRRRCPTTSGCWQTCATPNRYQTPVMRRRVQQRTFQQPPVARTNRKSHQLAFIAVEVTGTKMRVLKQASDSTRSRCPMLCHAPDFLPWLKVPQVVFQAAG